VSVPAYGSQARCSGASGVVEDVEVCTGVGGVEVVREQVSAVNTTHCITTLDMQKHPIGLGRVSVGCFDGQSCLHQVLGGVQMVCVGGATASQLS